MRNLPGGLEALLLVDGGTDLSSGQRQLLCIARALLRDAKILLCDEATSSVDAETDELVQTLLRREFVGKTVFTIAHRVVTIMDCDRILVMGGGKALEFGPPDELLAIPGGAFASLSARAGDVGAGHQSALPSGTDDLQPAVTKEACPAAVSVPRRHVRTSIV